MNTVEHADIGTGEIHPIANWVMESFFDIDNLPVSDADLFKVAVNADPALPAPELYILLSSSPKIWALLSLPEDISTFIVTSDANESKPLGQWISEFATTQNRILVTDSIISAKVLSTLQSGNVLCVKDAGAGQSNFYIAGAQVVENLPERFNTANGVGLIAFGINYADKEYVDAQITGGSSALAAAIAQEVIDRNQAISDESILLLNSIRDAASQWPFSDLTSSPLPYTPIEDNAGELLVFSASSDAEVDLVDTEDAGDFPVGSFFRAINIGLAGITLGGSGVTILGNTAIPSKEIVTVYRYSTTEYFAHSVPVVDAPETRSVVTKTVGTGAYDFATLADALEWVSQLAPAHYSDTFQITTIEIHPNSAANIIMGIDAPWLNIVDKSGESLGIINSKLNEISIDRSIGLGPKDGMVSIASSEIAKLELLNAYPNALRSGGSAIAGLYQITKSKIATVEIVATSTDVPVFVFSESTGVVNVAGTLATPAGASVISIVNRSDVHISSTDPVTRRSITQSASSGTVPAIFVEAATARFTRLAPTSSTSDGIFMSSGANVYANDCTGTCNATAGTIAAEGIYNTGP